MHSAARLQVRRRGRRLAGLLLPLLLAAPGCGRPDPAAGPTDPQATATYVGAAVCATCHADAHATYLATSHSRALRPVDLEEQPLPHEFTHDASGLSYRVYQQGGRMRVRESLLLENRKDRVVLADHAAAWTVGSGQSSLSYAAVIDGFLVEAPTTWYTRPQRWGMSPGYDVPAHEGFARPLDDRCLFCHVGRAEPIGGSGQRLRIHEEAIGCERCHGPGSAHVAARTRQPAIEGKDPTIVHPADLSRDLQMDVCAQCHLDHTLTVDVLGKRMEDWRPGLPLSDFRITYRLAARSDRMTVVGHVDQLKRSRCYTASEDMTCLSCHDPHDTPAPADRVAFYRAKCMACHAEGTPCGLDATARTASDHGDDCAACHMPRGKTDIPHFAFSDHRIAIHRPGDTPPPPATDLTLVPADETPALTPTARDRHLAFAYLLLSVRKPEALEEHTLAPEDYRTCLARARTLLERAHAGGARDPAVLGALAFLVRQDDPGRAVRMATAAATSDEPVPPDMRCSILQALTTALVASGQHTEALPWLDELVRLRRVAADWGLRAQALQALDDRHGAVASAEEAVRIAGHDPYVQEFAASIHAWAGDMARAMHHRRIAAQLRRVRAR